MVSGAAAASAAALRVKSVIVVPSEFTSLSDVLDSLTSSCSTLWLNNNFHSTIAGEFIYKLARILWQRVRKKKKKKLRDVNDLKVDRTWTVAAANRNPLIYWLFVSVVCPVSVSGHLGSCSVLLIGKGFTPPPPPPSPPLKDDGR